MYLRPSHTSHAITHATAMMMTIISIDTPPASSCARGVTVSRNQTSDPGNSREQVFVAHRFTYPDYGRPINAATQKPLAK
jgi:hypothetical protein